MIYVNSTIKITPEIAANIRLTCATEQQKVVAQRFGVSRSLVSMIVGNKSWRYDRIVSPLDRFLSQIAIGNDCWLWIGKLDKKTGYARFRGYDSKRIGAHEFAFRLFREPLVPGMFVCHKCDVRHCVRPSHLFLGTPLDNQIDSIQKGRKKYGEQIANHKLTASDVVAIRERFTNGESKRSLGRTFGVNRKTVKRIVEREAWNHI